MKIGFTGTVSIGKTTLVNELSKLPEFKDYKFFTERSKYLRDLGIPLNTSSTFKGQLIFMAERSRELMYKNIITDRTIIDVMAFTKNSNEIDYIKKESFTELASRLIPEYDILFYISPKGIKIEDNKVRTTDSKYRDRIDESVYYMITQEYKYLLKNIHEIHTSNLNERVKFVMEKIKEVDMYNKTKI